MYKVLILTIVMLSLLMVGVAVQYAHSAPYLFPPDPKILMVKEMKPGCRSGYDSNRELKRKLKLIWTYR